MKEKKLWKWRITKRSYDIFLCHFFNNCIELTSSCFLPKAILQNQFFDVYKTRTVENKTSFSCADILYVNADLDRQVNHSNLTSVYYLLRAKPFLICHAKTSFFAIPGSASSRKKGTQKVTTTTEHFHTVASSRIPLTL